MRTICLSGFSALSREWANEQPPDVEIWAMNEANVYLKRHPKMRWFQLHPRNWNAAKAAENGWNPDDYGRPDSHIQFLSKCEWPVYMQEPDPRIPTSVRYPYEAIAERYGFPWVDGTKRPYLTSTAAYMLALAVYEHDTALVTWPRRPGLHDLVGEIRLAGIELAIGTEYFHQRPCLEFWCGMAMGRGIRIAQSPYGTSILNGQIYAREHGEPLYPESMTAMAVTAGEPGFAAVMEDAEGNPVGL